MQRVMFEEFESDLHCPFCGHKTIWEGHHSTCEHLLFIAIDEALVYCSAKINRRTLLRRGREEGWDQATDKVKYPESVKFAMYLGGGSYGCYVGYAAPSAE